LLKSSAYKKIRKFLTQYGWKNNQPYIFGLGLFLYALAILLKKKEPETYKRKLKVGESIVISHYEK
jgi:hypothetical protein